MADHYRSFAEQLRSAIARYGDLPESEVVARQKAQLERLVALEGEFRNTLIRHPWGADVYRAFVHFITQEKRNILDARPYFRERQSVFTARIGEELKLGNEKGLYPFNFNYLFIQFAMRSKPWPQKSKIVKLEKLVAQARWELVEMNMPLAINRSRIFWRRTPESHLEYMDLVQIAATGLLVAIDKFVLPYSHRFRMVAIGRMTGFFIEDYSATMVHFFPTDKRKIYRANKIAHKFNGGANAVDWTKLADAVNKGVDDNHLTTPNEISALMAASSTVSADAKVSSRSGEDDGGDLITRFASRSDEQPDKLAEEGEARAAMYKAIEQLTVFESKYLRLKGLDL